MPKTATTLRRKKPPRKNGGTGKKGLNYHRVREDRKLFGAILRRQMEESGFASVKRYAKAIGTTPDRVSQVLRGQASIPYKDLPPWLFPLNFTKLDFERFHIRAALTHAPEGASELVHTLLRRLDRRVKSLEGKLERLRAGRPENEVD